MLKYRPRSVTEMKNRLRKRGIENDTIDQLIESFLELGYLDDSEFAKVALITDSKGLLIGGQVIAPRMGARLGYEILDRVESKAILRDKPLTKPRHERLRDYLETTYGPIR